MSASVNQAISQASRLLERARELEALQYGDFRLSSGASSGFYFDGRLLSMDPESVSIVAGLFLDALCREGVHVFGGPAVGAVPMVGALALLSHQREVLLRGFFVRSEPKSHGMGKLVEGDVRSGDAYAIYDDTISTGGSLLEAVSALDEIGAEARVGMCILDRRQGGSATLEGRGVPVLSVLRKTDEDRVVVDEESLNRWFG